VEAGGGGGCLAIVRGEGRGLYILYSIVWGGGLRLLGIRGILLCRYV